MWRETLVARLSTLAGSSGGVYGLVLVAGMIIVSRNLTGTSADALLTVVATLVVFFVAHVYAATVAVLVESGRKTGLRQALRHGVRDSAGLLVIGGIPPLILLLGVTGLLRQSDAVWIALIIDIALLGVLGWFIASARTSNVWARLGGVLITAACGGVMILFKVLIHH